MKKIANGFLGVLLIVPVTVIALAAAYEAAKYVYKTFKG